MSERKRGATSVSLLFRLTDATTGAPKTGLAAATLRLQYARPGEAGSAATALTALASATAAWAAYGAFEVDAANSPGVYRVDCPDAAFAGTPDEVAVTVNSSAVQPSTRLVDLMGVDLHAATGLVNSNAAQWGGAAVGGMPNSGAVAVSGTVNSNLVSVNGTAVSGTNVPANAVQWGGVAVTGMPLAASSYAAAPTAAAVATAVWQTDVSTGFTGTQAGAKLNAAGTASDPWAAALPGAYAAGSAGNVLGNKLGLTVTSGAVTLAPAQAFNNTGQTTKPAVTLAAADVTGSLPANITQVNGTAAATPSKVDANVVSVNGTAVTGANVPAEVKAWNGSAVTTGVPLAASAYAAPPTASQIDAQLAGTHGAGAWGGGAAYTPAQVAAAVWTDTADLTTAGSPGYLLAQNLDAKVSSRSVYAGGTVAGVTAPVTVGTNNDKTGYALAPSGLDAVPVESGVNARQALSPLLAASAGVMLGAGTSSIVFKGGNSTVTRITANTDNAGNRTAVTLSLPA